MGKKEIGSMTEKGMEGGKEKEVKEKEERKERKECL